MFKSVRFALLSLTLASGATVLTGCGGGGSSSLSPVIGRFAGTYNGTFSGVIAPGRPGAGTPVSGTFVANINNQGNITGTLSQPGIGNFPITGTIDNDGNINATAAFGNGQVSTLNGKLTLNNNTPNITGTFVTKSGDVTIVTGTISS